MRNTNLIHCLVYIGLAIAVVILNTGQWLIEIVGITIFMSIISFTAMVISISERDRLLQMLMGCYQVVPDDVKPLMAKALLEIGLSPKVLDENLTEKQVRGDNG